MEPIPLAYYAVICAIVSLLSPSIGGIGWRVAIGAVVGAGSAIAFPSFMAFMQ